VSKKSIIGEREAYNVYGIPEYLAPEYLLK